ncbi:hypothetical protein OS493_012235 [Desmophyllum pertusum]|uniref:Uncharacterized protein n=1 Tax=Desmophyllum pertusum TaxID=174260 RepID=A0A9X0A341_9CNID|nr:hypothetical protein OS493_012235 [Desmophyllum pertusum]
MKQMSFAQSSKSYSERDFQVRSCVSLAGPTSVGQIGVSACANVSKSESSTAKDMSTSDRLIIRGGSRETRSKLLNDRSKELIEQLMNEASDTHSSVQYTSERCGKILQSRFPSGEPNYVRGNVEDWTFRNSTTPNVRTKFIQNTSVLWLNKVATATRIAITNPFGVPVEGQRVSTTSLWNKIQVSPSKLHTQTPRKIADGMVAIGISLGLTALVTTKIVIGGKLYGLCPAEMPPYIKHVAMALTADEVKARSE